MGGTQVHDADAVSEPAFSIVQFRLPRSAAEALDLSTLRTRARAAGVEPPRFEYSTKDVRGGGYRITCRRPMAAFIVDELARVASSAEGQLVIDCAAGAKNALDAMKPHARLQR